MKNKRSVGILLILLLVLALPLVCFGQDATTKATLKQEDQPLQLTIKSDKQVYEVGEEVNIIGEIKNKGKESSKIYGPSFHDVSEIIVTNSKGIRMEPKGVMADINNLSLFVTIPAGGSYSHTFRNLRWDSSCSFWGFFDEAKLLPDTYRIYITIINPPKRPKRVGAITSPQTEQLSEVKRLGSGFKYMKTDLSGTLTSNTITIEVVEKKELPAPK